MHRTIRIATTVPGPRSLALMERRRQSVPRGVATSVPVFIAAARGATLTDVDGNVYVDFGGGVGCLNVGSTHPEVVEAIQSQAERFLHTAAPLLMYEGYLQVAEQLGRISPIIGPTQVFLANSGTEAVENAVKIARSYTKRPAVIAFRNAFHGRSLLGMSLSARASFKLGFGPLAPEVYRAPYPYFYRSSYADAETCGKATLAEFETMLNDEIGPNQVAAIVMEAMQGEGGFIVPPANFVRGVRDYCTHHGIVLVIDEIQTGFCRTGRMFACEHFEIEPDLMVVGKSLAAGLPLAAVVGRAEIMDAPQVGGLGGTFAGNPLACAAATRVIAILERDNCAERARQIGVRLLQRFDSWRDRYPLVGDARGLGAMVALELVMDRSTKEPAERETDQVHRYCYTHGLVIPKAGPYNNVLRFLGPLVLTDDQVDEGLEVLEQGIERVGHNLMA